MHVLQILLPLYDHKQRPLPASLHTTIKAELTGKFGGVSVHVRSPAEGKWKDAGNGSRDDIAVYEVVATTLEAAWWQAYRQKLESRFHQEEITIRALPIGIL